MAPSVTGLPFGSYLCLASAVLALLLAWAIGRHHERSPAHPYFAALAAAMALWDGAFVVMYCQTDPRAAMEAFRVGAVGICLVPGLVTANVLALTGHTRLRSFLGALVPLAFGAVCAVIAVTGRFYVDHIELGPGLLRFVLATDSPWFGLFHILSVVQVANLLILVVGSLVLRNRKLAWQARWSAVCYGSGLVLTLAQWALPAFYQGPLLDLVDLLPVNALVLLGFVVVLTRTRFIGSAEARLESAGLDACRTGVVLVDDQGAVVGANRAWEQLRTLGIRSPESPAPPLMVPGPEGTPLGAVHWVEARLTPDQVCRLGDLSDREREVALALVSGRDPAQIADELCVAPSTVASHTKRLYRKLRVHNRLELLGRFL